MTEDKTTHRRVGEKRSHQITGLKSDYCAGLKRLHVLSVLTTWARCESLDRNWYKNSRECENTCQKVATVCNRYDMVASQLLTMWNHFGTHTHTRTHIHAHTHIQQDICLLNWDSVEKNSFKFHKTSSWWRWFLPQHSSEPLPWWFDGWPCRWSPCAAWSSSCLLLASSEHTCVNP